VLVYCDREDTSHFNSLLIPSFRHCSLFPVHEEQLFLVAELSLQSHSDGKQPDFKALDFSVTLLYTARTGLLLVLPLQASRSLVLCVSEALVCPLPHLSAHIGHHRLQSFLLQLLLRIHHL